MNRSYQTVYDHSVKEPEVFWEQTASTLHWYTPWEKVLDDSKAPFYRWFSGATFNTCYNALDIHIENGRGDQAAIIYDSPVTKSKSTLSYIDLREQVALFAGALANAGVVKGDRVIVYMPMVPEAAIAMLACARLGAVHCVVFGGFAANELAVRIDDAKAKVVISASCGVEGNRVIEYKPLLDEAITIAQHKPEQSIILQRSAAKADLQYGRDLDWVEAIAAAKPHACVPVESTDPLYILYTSGTTGEPKGIVRDNGGHAVALKWSMQNIYDIKPGEVFWAASDVGWVVGHSYIVYGPLLNGHTTLIYEG
ncbi:MAG: AMP-binding protein, partial [Gammaproteobacteria bacterium]